MKFLRLASTCTLVLLLNLQDHFLLHYVFYSVIISYAVFKVHRGLLPYNGGDNENRTRDLLLARQALSQLSYAPIRHSGTDPED